MNLFTRSIQSLLSVILIRSKTTDPNKAEFNDLMGKLSYLQEKLSVHAISSGVGSAFYFYKSVIDRDLRKADKIIDTFK